MEKSIEHILGEFFHQVENNQLATSHFPSNYSNLTLKVGFGFGNLANIPWIVFLAEGQTPQKGIFPALYFFKEYHRLILAYGISETERPTKSWRAPLKIQTINSYFKALGRVPHKYGLSYVYADYSTIGNLNFRKIEEDLEKLIDHYKTLFPEN